MSIASLASIETTASDPAVVAVAAADRRIRVQMAGALAGDPELHVRAGASARSLVTSGAPHDLLVAYFEALGSEELALFAEIRRDSPELLIVAVCQSATGRGARRAVDGGVDGLVLADQLAGALAPTVAAVLAGQTAVPRDLRAGVCKQALSHREKQILGMVVMGFTNAEIGSRLYLAESTVKSHLSAAFAKLGVSSRNEATALILDPHGSLGTGILALTNCD